MPNFPTRIREGDTYNRQLNPTEAGAEYLGMAQRMSRGKMTLGRATACAYGFAGCGGIGSDGNVSPLGAGAVNGAAADG